VNTSTLQRLARPTLAALVLASLAACAVSPPQAPEDQIRQRATARWQALIFGKFDMSYALHSPSYRKAKPYDKYFAESGNAFQWTAVEVYGVRCEEAACNVRLAVTINSPLPQKFNGTMTTAVDETWVLEEGQWWLSPKQ
jgi:hypothetical protein